MMGRRWSFLQQLNQRAAPKSSALARQPAVAVQGSQQCVGPPASETADHFLARVSLSIPPRSRPRLLVDSEESIEVPPCRAVTRDASLGPRRSSRSGCGSVSRGGPGLRACGESRTARGGFEARRGCFGVRQAQASPETPEGCRPTINCPGGDSEPPVRGACCARVVARHLLGASGALARPWRAVRRCRGHSDTAPCTFRQSVSNCFFHASPAQAKWWDKGVVRVAGVDEAGRGPLAGPVVAAACVMPASVHIVGRPSPRKPLPLPEARPHTAQAHRDRRRARSVPCFIRRSRWAPSNTDTPHPTSGWHQRQQTGWGGGAGGATPLHEITPQTAPPPFTLD